MRKEQVQIVNETGLHARPAATFVKTAQQFKSSISVSLNGKEVDAKSLLLLLTLGASKDTLIEICAEGLDENQAVEELVRLVESDLD